MIARDAAGRRPRRRTHRLRPPADEAEYRPFAAAAGAAVAVLICLVAVLVSQMP